MLTILLTNGEQIFHDQHRDFFFLIKIFAIFNRIFKKEKGCTNTCHGHLTDDIDTGVTVTGMIKLA